MHSINLVPTEFGTYRTLCACVNLSCWTPSSSRLDWQPGLWQDHPPPAPQDGQTSSLLCRSKSIAAVGANAQILSPLSNPSQRFPVLLWLAQKKSARNEHTDCYLNALHCFAITTEERVGSPNTQMAQSWGGLLAWRRTGLVFNMFYFKFCIQGGKTMHSSEGKCKILHVGCYAHMEQVTPAQALKTAKFQ